MKLVCVILAALLTIAHVESSVADTFTVSKEVEPGVHRLLLEGRFWSSGTVELEVLSRPVPANLYLLSRAGENWVWVVDDDRHFYMRLLATQSEVDFATKAEMVVSVLFDMQTGTMIVVPIGAASGD